MALKNLLNITKDKESYLILALLVILILVIYRCRTENFSDSLVDKYIERGPFGADGDQGDNGEEGEEGEEGDKGPKGISALNKLKKNESLGLGNNNDIYDAGVMLLDYVKSEVNKKFTNIDDNISDENLTKYIEDIKKKYSEDNELVDNQTGEVADDNELIFDSEFPDFCVLPHFGGSTTGWQLCDGSELKLAGQDVAYKDADENSVLTPDLRGRFVLGGGNVSETDVLNDSFQGNLSRDDKVSGNHGRKPANYVSKNSVVNLENGGGIYGSVYHKLTYNQIPSHTHKYDATPKQMGHCNSAKKKWDNRHGRNNMNGTWTSGEKGSDTKHNNMPPYVKLNYIIKQPSKNAN
jgi:hypothetical protein